VIERCSGHGGAWGVMKDNFDIALKIGKPVARAALKNNKTYVSSECPLAGAHILQGMEAIRKDGDPDVPEKSLHPIQIFARAYGL
ncbi:MAG: glycerol-3-phosphate dehydrogenase, partial [Rhodospirillales bacterium]